MDGDHPPRRSEPGRERGFDGAGRRRVLERRAYPRKRRIPKVSPPVAITVPTVQRMSRVSRLAISVPHAGNLDREPRVEIRDFGPHLGNLSALLRNLPGELGDLPRQLSPLPGHLSPQFREAGLELVGCDLVAVLGSLPHRIRDGIGLGRCELGVGERTGDGVGVEHAPPIIAEDTDPVGAGDCDGRDLAGWRTDPHCLRRLGPAAATLFSMARRYRRSKRARLAVRESKQRFRAALGDKLDQIEAKQDRETRLSTRRFIVSCALWCVSCAPWVVGVITAFRAGNQPQPAQDVAVSGVLRHRSSGRQRAFRLRCSASHGAGGAAGLIIPPFCQTGAGRVPRSPPTRAIPHSVMRYSGPLESPDSDVRRPNEYGGAFVRTGCRRIFRVSRVASCAT